MKLWGEWEVPFLEVHLLPVNKKNQNSYKNLLHMKRKFAVICAIFKMYFLPDALIRYIQ